MPGWHLDDPKMKHWHTHGCPNMMQKQIVDMPKMIPRWHRRQKMSVGRLQHLYKISIEREYQDCINMTHELNIDSWIVVLTWCKKQILDIPKMVPRLPKKQKMGGWRWHKIYRISIGREYQDGTKIAHRFNVDSWMVVRIGCKSKLLTMSEWYQYGPKLKNRQLHECTSTAKLS